jgi:hypothetical protein
MPKAVLLVDALAYLDDDGVRQEIDGSTLDPPQASARGAEVELPSEAFEHHKKHGNVVAAGSKAGKEASAEAAESESGE